MIAVTSKNTAADLPRLAEGFKYVGASGKALGVSDGNGLCNAW